MENEPRHLNHEERAELAVACLMSSVQGDKIHFSGFDPRILIRMLAAEIRAAEVRGLSLAAEICKTAGSNAARAAEDMKGNMLLGFESGREVCRVAIMRKAGELEARL